MCPPCKIILDCGGVLPASAQYLADVVGTGSPLWAPARYYAAIGAASERALLHAITTGVLGKPTKAKPVPPSWEEAHAWAELSCHRAAVLREQASRLLAESRGELIAEGGNAALVTPDSLMAWAEEHRLFATRMIGGEFESDVWTVDGSSGIVKAETGQ